MRAYIDAEVYLYPAIVTAQYEVEFQPDMWTYICNHSDAKTAFDKDVAKVKDVLPDADVVLVFGDSTNFRYAVYPEYKSNRRSTRRPAGYGALRQWAMDTWESEKLPGIEGDDCLGLMARGGDVIVSRDKDLKTIPGLHLRDGELEEISEDQANRTFYAQVLTGDATDGYPGCPGCGPVGAAKVLAGCKTELEMWLAVLEAYQKAGKTREFALQMARCARILRPGEYDRQRKQAVLWNPPVN